MCFFFFNDTATTEIYTLSLHDALPISATKLGFISANTGADTSIYNSLQKKSAELVSQAKNISQFLDRDTRPDFASTVVIDRKSTRLNSSHANISYAVFCLKKKK